MRRHRLGLAALSALLVALPSAAHAADYHHVHLAAPNVAEAVQWYITNMGCTAMNRPDACQIGATQSPALQQGESALGAARLCQKHGQPAMAFGVVGCEIQAAVVEVFRLSRHL